MTAREIVLYDEAVSRTIERLRQAGIESAEVDARLLAEYAGLTRDTDVSDERTEKYVRCVERRLQREPLQHITGTMHFRFLELDVAPGTFIVRPETEWMVDEAIKEAQRLDKSVRVVDLCSGSGAIALSLATEVPDSQVWAVELSASAYATALANNERYGHPVHFVHGDARTALPILDGTVDIVISNPPYIPADESITAEAQRDPQIALWGGGEAGTDMPCAIIDRAASLLTTGGLLVMEHAENQSKQLRAYARERGFNDVHTGRDATGRERWLYARAPEKNTQPVTNGECGASDTNRSSVCLSQSPIITITTKATQADAIRRACTSIHSGELIVLPTDTVYGIGADPFSPQAVTRLLNAKGRAASKPSPVLVASWSDVERLAVCDERARALGDAFFPGPLTLILPVQKDAALTVGDTGGTVAVRMPDHYFTLELLAATGPLAVSSANLTDHEPACTIRQAFDMLGNTISLYIDGGNSPENSQASTILSLVGPPCILREGSISSNDIAGVLGEVIPCASTS